MRSDLISYFVGIICIIIGLYIPLQFGWRELINTALLVVFFLFGFFFFIFGYSLRPRKILPITPKPVEAPPTAPMPEKIEEPKPAEAKPTIELTQVKGIGQKRAAQLKDIGILTAQDLAKASATEIAAKLKVSEKIVEKWIQEAKSLETH